ncbi:MAG: glycosyltransferase family 92 protein, partial [Chloroflexota bacterium]|nr:glycosyltransferase family 92 protein [Chloroflexota bacterium]
MTLRRRLGRIVSGPSESAPPAGPAKHKGGTKGKMLRAKPPNVIGRGPLLGGRGFDVVVVCIVKDEADYLEEWLAYHVALGVDHFVIYDNGSTDGSAALLERYVNHGLVTRIDWPLGGGQLSAYNHSLRMFGATSRWLAYYDVDEFLVPLLDDDIPSFLARFEDAAVVRVSRVEFGFSGHRSPPAGLSMDAYTQVANVLDLDPALPPRVKSIVQPGAVSAIDIHLAFPADDPAPGAPTET